MKKEREYIIEKKKGISFILNKNNYIRIIDIEGKQVADLVAFSRENINEKLSTAVTLDNNGSIYIRKGDFLFSNRYKRMLKVIEDTVGKHDILYPACSPEMYKYQYKILEYHPSCLENFTSSLKEYGISEEDIPNPFNIFMNTEISTSGKITVEEPISKGDDYIELKAEMDLIVAIAACSAEESRCNAFNCTSIKVQIYN